MDRSSGFAPTTETDIDVVGGWSGSLTSGSGGGIIKSERERIGKQQTITTKSNNAASCGKCGAGGFPSEMHLGTHEKYCGSSAESDAESLSGKENPSSSMTAAGGGGGGGGVRAMANSIGQGRGTSTAAGNNASNRASSDKSTSNARRSRERSKSRSKKSGESATVDKSSQNSSSRRHRSRSPLRSMIQRARSRSPTRRGVSFARDRTPKRTGRGAGGFLSPNAATPCASNRGAAHITSGYLTAASLTEDALEGRPSAIDLIPELGMSGAMASLAGRCVEVDSICPRAGIDEAVGEYRRNVLGITDQAFREMHLEDYKNIPL